MMGYKKGSDQRKLLIERVLKMEKTSYFVHEDYKLKEAEKITDVVLIGSEKEGSWLMVHTEKSVFRINIDFAYNSVFDFNVIGEELKEIFIDGQCIELDTTNKTLRI
jgi:hypothetical protein